MPKQKEVKQQIAPMSLRASFDSTTVNEKDRTVDVVFATETPVRMMGWDGPFYEILSMDSGHARLDRLNSGAPLLDNHDAYSGVRTVLGVVEKATIIKKEGRATVRFSKRADVESVWNDVKDNILKGVSLRYRVYAYEIEEKEGEIPTARAVDWEGFEISLAPVPADYKSSVRGAEKDTLNDITITHKNAEKPILNTEKSRSMTPEEQEAAAAAANKPAAAAVPAPVNAEEVRKLAISEERKRSADIFTAVRAAKLPDTFADKLITDGTSIDEARKLVIEEFAKADPAVQARGANATVTSGADEVDKRRTAMEEAIAHRADPTKELTEKVKGSEYRGMSLMRMAEECVVLAGGKVRGLSAREIATAALNIDGQRAGLLSTSDFPIILGNTIGRKLMAEYALAERTFTQWTTRATAVDFKQMTRARLGEFDSFEEVKEGANYKSGSMGEGKEVYSVKKYGKKIGVTWETLINDDLGAFSRLPKKIADAAARLQSDLVYGILTANAAMGDGVTLFHATHGNLGTAGAIAVGSLGEARKLLRVMKGLNSKDYLNLTPSFLLVGPEYETLALQYTSADFLPTAQAQVNPYKNLSVIVEPRLTGNQWYVIASPNAIDTLEYAFLDGNGELYTETRQSFDTDGLEVKARMVFGAKAIDYRGIIKNAGA